MYAIRSYYETDRDVRDQAADLAQPDHAERVPGQLDAGVGLLARLDALAQIRGRGVEPAHVV